MTGCARNVLALDELPTEVLLHVFSRIEQGGPVVLWTRLRRVCKRWKLLTDKFVEDWIRARVACNRVHELIGWDPELAFLKLYMPCEFCAEDSRAGLRVR
jgi:hypothetical protein